MSKVQFDIDHVQLWTNFSTQSEQKNSLNNINIFTIYFDTDIDITITGLVFLCLLIIIII